MTQSKLSGALKGLVVLDVTQAFAGPFCTQMMADHGADVIKVEPPKGGDVTRMLPPFAPGDTARPYGALFQHCNRNKRGIAIDLKSPEGRAAFLRLVAGADVLVENFRYGVMARLGLDFEVLRAVNPRLVYTSIRGFGDDAGGKSPYAPLPAVDIVAQAMGGIMSVTGPDAATPSRVGCGLGDAVPGLFAAFGTLAAVIEARASGLGQYVDVAMADGVFAICEAVSTFYGYSGQAPVPTGNRLPEIAPFGTVRTKDGWAALAVPPGRAWEEFATAVGKPEWISDPRFATVLARVQNRAAVYDAVESVTLGKTRAELMALLSGVIPFAPIYDAADIAADPHFAAREMLVPLDHPGIDQKLNVVGVPVKLSRTPGAVAHRAPLLGEHTDEVLAAAGLSPEDIGQLRSAGAVA